VAGFPPIVLRDLSVSGLMLNIYIRSCNTDLCLFIALLAHVLAGLCSRCCGGSVAMRIADLNNCFSVLRCSGSVNACTSNASVGDVLRPPVIANIPALWTDVSLLLHSEILPAV
jgi:hypothetical protein